MLPQNRLKGKEKISVEEFKGMKMYRQRLNTPKESDLQKSCIAYFRRQYPKYSDLLFAIPNGGFRNGREAKNLQRQGVLSGVPDLMLAAPFFWYHGLFIELKRGKNKLTPNQIAMMDRLENRGYCVKVVRSLDEFINVVKEYLP